MTSLPPHLESVGSDLERAARRRVAALRRRRRVQTAVLAVAGVLVATGGGLAASGVDLVGWLRTDDPSPVRYLVDTTETYTGPAPQQIECDDVRAETFLCRPLPTAYTCEQLGKGPYPCGALGRSQRVYWLGDRVEPNPRIDRDLLLEGIERARRDGMPDRLGDRLQRAAEDVSDEFLVKLDLLSSVGGGRTYRERPDGTPAVPPKGVPLQVTCTDGPGKLVRCRDVAGATDVPLRAPIYGLEPTADWAPFEPAASTASEWAEIEAFFGHELSEDENLVFLILFVSGEESPEDWRQFERALERAGVLE